MTARKFIPVVFLTLLTATLVVADLTTDDLQMLQDPGGWDYIKMTDSGMRKEHVCFDGAPHPDECSGRLTLRGDHTFTQEVTIQGERVARHGTYTLKDDQLTFVDEFENPDGPYTVELNTPARSLVLSTSAVRIELMLHEKPKKDQPRKDQPKNDQKDSQ